MRISIANLFMAMTIVGLAIALVVQQKTDRTITIVSQDLGAVWALEASVLKHGSPKNRNSEPPLPAASALAIADAMIPQLEEITRNSESNRWTLSSLNLVAENGLEGLNSRHWFYVASFRGPPSSNNNFEPGAFSAIILMDESVIVGEQGVDQFIWDEMRTQFQD